MLRSRFCLRRVVTLGGCLAVAGCAVGPDYKTPASPAGSAYGKAAMPAVTASADDRLGGAQHFVAGADIPAQWWTLFHSPALNRLVDQALRRNPSLAAALAEACQSSFRPVMMPCIAACVGLLPAAFSTEIGSQVQRPLALVVVGGIVLAPVLVLLVLPVLIGMFSRRERAAAAEIHAVPAE